VKLFFMLAITEGAACMAGMLAGQVAWAWALVVSVVIFLLLGIMLGFAYFRLVNGDWDNIADDTFLEKEAVDIPMADGWQMACKVLKATGSDGKRLPVAICHHGLSGNGKKLLWLAIPLAMNGYLVMLPDARGHGESARRFKRARMDDWYITDATGVMPDYKRVLDYACSRPDADTSRGVVAIGHSLGAATSIVSAFPDPRVKLVISMSSYYSFVDILEAKRGRVPLTEPWFSKHFLRNIVSFGKLRGLNEKISPKNYLDLLPKEEAIRKIRLVHAKDDKLVLLEASADKIIAHLGLPADHVFLPEKGDHSLRGQETAVAARIVQWLDDAFRPAS